MLFFLQVFFTQESFSAVYYANRQAVDCVTEHKNNGFGLKLFRGLAIVWQCFGLCIDLLFTCSPIINKIPLPLKFPPSPFSVSVILILRCHCSFHLTVWHQIFVLAFRKSSLSLTRLIWNVFCQVSVFPAQWMHLHQEHIQLLQRAGRDCPQGWSIHGFNWLFTTLFLCDL